MLILDTNVLSEILRPEPSSQVIEWLEWQSRSQLFTTTISQAEILYGVALVPKSARRDKLAVATRAIFEEDFDEKVLAFDSRAADCYVTIAAMRKSDRTDSDGERRLPALGNRCSRRTGQKPT